MEKEKKLILKNEFIKDYFYLHGTKIVILENNAFKNIDKNLLVLAKVIENGNEREIKPLTEEEYDQAIKKYDSLVKLIKNEEE